MGMYTELHFNSRLKEDLPDNVIRILKYMTGEVDEPCKDDHPLFETERWWMMLRGMSAYFDSKTNSQIRFDDIAECYFLHIQCNLKNYDSEIQLFLDWIKPYLDKEDNEFLGFYLYEETEMPTLIFHQEAGSGLRLYTPKGE